MMRIPGLKLIRHTALAVLVFSVPVGLAAAESPAPAADAESAVWTKKESNFVFMGFTAHYSCDGLRDKIAHALTELGARRDFTLSYSGCSSPFGSPDPFPGVRISMHVLQPAGAGDQGAEIVATHWRRVDLHLDKDPVWEASDCELLEQIKQKILPLFTTRNVDFASNCVPHQAFLGTRLAADLLFPDQKGDKPPASK